MILFYHSCNFYHRKVKNYLKFLLNLSPRNSQGLHLIFHDSLTAADDVSDQANEMLAANNVPIDNPAAIRF